MLCSILGHAALLLCTIVSASQTDNISTIFQVDRNGAWVENLAIRHTGHILATRIDVPELWSIDPSASPNHAGSHLYSIPNATSLLGIAEIEPNVYAVVAGNFSVQKVQATKGSVRRMARVDITNTNTKPDIQASLITRLPEADFLDGLIRFDDHHFLV